jgi:cation diffusion facilitator family transporter
MLNDRWREGRKVTLIGMAVNVLMIAVKLTGGWLGRSQALIADGIHSVTDLLNDFVVLVGLSAGSRPADDSHPFGHGRVETLASMVVGGALLLVAVSLGFRSARDIYMHVERHPAFLTIVAAAFSILAKEAMSRYTTHVGRKIMSPVVLANAWDQRSDALSSVAALIGVGGAWLNPSWHILDSYAAMVVSLMIFMVGIGVIRNSLKEFTDAAPAPEIMQQVESCARKVAGVIDVHDLKARTSGGLVQLEVHIVVDSGLTVKEGHAIATEVEACLLEEVHQVLQVTIHVEPAEEEARPAAPPAAG